MLMWLNFMYGSSRSGHRRQLSTVANEPGKNKLPRRLPEIIRPKNGTNKRSSG